MDLHSFAKNGNIKGIKQSLKNKRAMFALDEEMGWSPLHYASNSSKTKIVQLILNAGISPNIKSAPPQGEKQSDWNLALEKNEHAKDPVVYPMDVADGPNRLKIVTNLKEKGGKFYGNEMTLQQAIQMEDIDEIEALLEDESIRVNGRDSRGWMAIHYAVELNNQEMCDLLFEYKANPNGSCHDGQLNPYEIALDNNHEGVIVAGGPYWSGHPFNAIGADGEHQTTSGAAVVWAARDGAGNGAAHWDVVSVLTGVGGHWGTTAGASHNAALGADVDIFKNTIVVGAPSGKYDGVIQGAALVYTGYNPNSVIDKPEHWNWATTLTASDGVGGDRFGSSVSMPNSSTIIIGSPRQVGVGLASVYVFTGAGSSWTQTQKITYSGASSSDVYGHYDNSLAATQKEIFVGGDEGTPENVIRYRI